MRIDLTLRDPHGLDHDVAVIAPEGTRFAAVVASLAELSGLPRHRAWRSGAEQLTADAPLGGAGLRSGAVVSSTERATTGLAHGAVLRLHVVGGPDSGRVIGLPRGLLTIGRAADCDLVLTDPDVSRRHASLTVTSGGTRVHDLGSTNGTSIDGDAVDRDGTSLLPGDLLRVGDSLLTLAGADDAPAALRSGPGGSLLLNRPPRLNQQPVDREIEIPPAPSRGPIQRVQWIAALLPAVAGIALAVMLHSLQFLVFLLLSPVVMLASALGDRLHWRRSRRRDAATHARRAAAALEEITAGLSAETDLRRRAAPDPAALNWIATAHTARLWERRRSDPDALFVRLGVADVSSTLRARQGRAVTSAGQVAAVPVGVDLRCGPVGIAAPSGIALGVARWLLAQLAVLHSSADLEVALLLSDDAREAWTWVRWLPHLCGRVAATAEQRVQLVADLIRLVEQRQGDRRNGPLRWSGRWLVLVVHRAGELSDLPGLAALLSRGSAAGVTAICVDRDEQRLPTICAATARAVGETGGRLRIRHGEGTDLAEPLADRVTVEWADNVARALSPLVDVASDPGAGIPDECRLLDLLGLAEPSMPALRDRWQRSDGGSGTVVGVGPSGPVTIDLARDGPHALVAGTTGAGKSELLQALVAGLAATHPPSAISFVLIDYKGGAAFSECARLPHVAGLVTDLDVHLTERALQSLDCELRQREELLARAGAKDLGAYLAGAPADPLTRLVLVVDEFAALAEELPDFVSGLIGIAQRGRSLGVHLVLATQRPGGVVSPEIRANTTLRIALRVADPAESIDVIGSAVAASIDRCHPGRAFAHSGTALTQFQTARVSVAARVGDAEPTVRVAVLDGWRRLPTAAAEPVVGKTDLQMLVDAVRETAADTGVAQPRRPWLPPLPERVPAHAVLAGSCASSIAFGLADLPRRQLQPSVELDLDAGGAVLFTGAARSGKTSALATIALTAAARLGPDDLHIYGIDCGAGGLGALADLPHCGTLASVDDFDVVAALLRRLDGEITWRRTHVVELRTGSVAEARAAGHRLPLMLFLVDGWVGFLAAADEYDGGRSAELAVGLLRSAASAAFTAVITGDRTTLAPRYATAFATKYLLRMADRADYALAGVPTRAVPEAMPPGRAMRAADAAEVQIAFAGSRPTPAEQSARAREIAARFPPEVTRSHPIRLRPLPGRVGRTDLPETSGRFRLGIGGDQATPITLDLFAGAGRLLVAGPPRSGRSTALRTLLLEAVDRRVAVVVAGPPRSPVVAAAALHGVLVLAPEARPEEAAPLGLDRSTLLLVDDSETFTDTAVGDQLAAIARQAPQGLAIVVAGSNDQLALTYRGVAAEVRRSRCALLLQPTPVDGELVGLRLARRRAGTIAGRGVLVADPGWGCEFGPGAVPIQVATTP